MLMKYSRRISSKRLILRRDDRLSQYSKKVFQRISNDQFFLWLLLTQQFSNKQDF